MKKFLLVFVLILASINVSFAQDIFENKEFGFSINHPANWIETNKSEILKNLENIYTDDEKLVQIINESKGSLLLNSFYKYNPKTHAGLIPTVQINVRANPAPESQFFNMMAQSAKGFKNYFEDFEFIEEPKEIEISGIKSVSFVGKFTMKTQNGQSLKVRSRTYAIPNGKYFFQVNFTDGQIDEDASLEFDALVKTIKIGKEKS